MLVPNKGNMGCLLLMNEALEIESLLLQTHFYSIKFLPGRKKKVSFELFNFSGERFSSELRLRDYSGEKTRRIKTVMRKKKTGVLIINNWVLS